jgi:hypothetical protein
MTFAYVNDVISEAEQVNVQTRCRRAVQRRAIQIELASLQLLPRIRQVGRSAHHPFFDGSIGEAISLLSCL